MKKQLYKKYFTDDKTQSFVHSAFRLTWVGSLPENVVELNQGAFFAGSESTPYLYYYLDRSCPLYNMDLLDHIIENLKDPGDVDTALGKLFKEYITQNE